MNRSSEVTRPILKRIALAVTIAGIAITAILLISVTEREPMTPAEARTQTKRDVPPIDEATPAETKTATFAMG
jgi:hypothetical protein